MAKKDTVKKKMNPLVWVVFAIILPLIIILVITSAILIFAGFDLVAWAAEKGSTMPVISKYIKTDDEQDLQIKLDRAKDTIDKQQDELNELHNEIASLESINEQLNQDLVKLENKLASEDSLADGDEKEKPDHLKQTAGSFRKMDEERAANILQNLDKPSAVQILQQLSNDARGKILEEMEPKTAADLTKLMLDD